MCALAGEKLHEDYPDAVFLAAALGCPFELTRMLAGCGFDLIFDSSKWWDFHQRWFLGQYDELRRIAPTVAFPEDHNTPRLAVEAGVTEPQAIAALYRARYLATLGIGCGTMMPMGFEFGCLEPLDPVTTTPESWERETRAPRVDLRDFIAAAHRVNAETLVLNLPGRQRRVTAPNARIVGLLRFDKGSPASATAASILLVNPDHGQSDGLALSGLLTSAGGRFSTFQDSTPFSELDLTQPPDRTPQPLCRCHPRSPQAPEAAETLAQLRMRVIGNQVSFCRITPRIAGVSTRAAGSPAPATSPPM